MIIVFKPKTKDEDVQKIVKQVEDEGLTTHIVVGTETTICGIIEMLQRLILNNWKCHLLLIM